MLHNRDWLEDIVVHAHYVSDMLKETTFDAFDSDLTLQFAVQRCLEIIGEASGKLDDATRSRSNDIPWQKMKNMRNILIHSYRKADNHLVWETATKVLPSLLPSIEQLLKAVTESENK